MSKKTSYVLLAVAVLVCIGVGYTAYKYNTAKADDITSIGEVKLKDLYGTPTPDQHAKNCAALKQICLKGSGSTKQSACFDYVAYCS